METINLLNILMEKLLQNNLSTNTKKIIHYFLEENIKAIFGKVEFKAHEINLTPYNELNSNYILKGFHILWKGELYNLYLNVANNIITISSENSIQTFRLLINSNVSIHDTITHMEDEKLITETKYIYASDAPYFEYRKVVHPINGEKENITYFGARPTGIKKNGYIQFKIGDIGDIKETEISNTDNITAIDVLKAIFQIIKNELKRKRTVVGLPLTNELDLYDNLGDIYKILKEEANFQLSKEYTRIRK